MQEEEGGMPGTTAANDKAMAPEEAMAQAEEKAPQEAEGTSFSVKRESLSLSLPRFFFFSFSDGTTNSIALL